MIITNKYSDYVSEMQKEEDEKDESSVKILHRMRMSNNYTPVQKDLNDFKDNFEQACVSINRTPLSLMPSNQKPQPIKSILKKFDQELYIHKDIEWNQDK
mmetsp:Transcript_33455/g.32914  ORF Transcript_33455/g.32914 Transcript_33455/m.32914 type:complete len:100 (-) Transcript_33455:299-598(-)